MFGIKTKIIKDIRKAVSKTTQGRLFAKSNNIHLMDYFQADLMGHMAHLESGDLGYGGIHYAFVRAGKPRHVLCIGSRYGYIPGILAQACKDNGIGRVDFVDAGYDEESEHGWTGVGFWKTPKGENTFKDFGLAGWIKTYVMTSEEFSKKSKTKYGYIYIDGDHSYKGVKKDFDLFWKKLQKGGFMAFHDISVTKPQPEGIYGVNRLWKEISKKGKALSFDYPHSGLGIIQK